MADATFAVGMDCYLDTREPDQAHNGLPYVPMLKDTTTWLLERGKFPDVSADAAVTQPFVLNLRAATTFDGTPVIAVVPIVEQWTTRATSDDAPDTSLDSPLTFTGAIAAGDWVQVDVSSFVAGVLDGDDFFGWEITRTDTGTAGSFESDSAFLAGDYDFKTDEPTTVSPSGGRIVGTSKPVVKAQYSAGVSAIRVQLADYGVTFVKASGFVSDASKFDSGIVATTEVKLDLSLTAFSGLHAYDSGDPDASRSLLSFSVKDATSGIWSDYSDPVVIGGWLAVPEVTVTSQAFGYAGTVNPTRTWSVVGTQTQWQVITTDSTDPLSVWDDSGQVSSAATSYTPAPTQFNVLQAAPVGTNADGVLLATSVPASQEIRAWDDVDREATEGFPTYGSASNTFQFSPNDTVATVDDVTAEQVGLSPWVDIKFSTSTTFDHAIIEWGSNNDTTKHIARKKPENLVLLGDSEGTQTYLFRWWGAQPWQPGYVAGVKLEVGSTTSKAVYASLDSLEVTGRWLGCAVETSKLYLRVAQDSGVGSTSSRQDQAYFLTAYGAQFPAFQWVTEGFITVDAQGVIRDFNGTSASDWEGALRSLANSGEVLQVAYDNISYPCAVTNYSNDELDGSGDPFVKQVRYTITQLGSASFADEPVGFGAPTITTYDFETDIDGNATTDGGLILKASVDGGSPGVVDKDGQPKTTAASAQHGVMGADLGWSS